MNDREKWRERVRDIRATSTKWWWWCYHLYLPVLYSPVYMYMYCWMISLWLWLRLWVYNISVLYWPPTQPNMPFQRRRKCIFHWRGRAWLIIWERVKIPLYSHKLKRMTCELHFSYFRSMTIKHTIPKTADVHIPDGQLWRDIEWESNYYITQCTGNSRSWRQDAVEKASIQEREPSDPRMSLGIRRVGDKMR